MNKKLLSLLICSCAGLLGCSFLNNFQAVNAEEVLTEFDVFKQNCVLTNAELSLSGDSNELMVTQTASSVSDYPVDPEKGGTNQTSTFTYTQPIDLTDNGYNIPFVSFSINSQTNNKYDMEAMIFSLTDTPNPEEAKVRVSIMLVMGATNQELAKNSFDFMAKGIDDKELIAQGFAANNFSNNTKKLNDISSYLVYGSDNQTPSTCVDHEIGLYYDCSTQKVWTDNYNTSFFSRLPSDYRVRGSDGTNRVLIRDLTIEDLGEELTPGSRYKNVGSSFTTPLETGYLSITTIRSIWNYSDYGDQIKSTFKDKIYSFGENRNSGYGARYFINSIDGVSSETVDETFIHDDEKLNAANPIFDGEKVYLAGGYRYYSFKPAQARTTYIKVTDEEGQTVQVNGLKSGKWQEGCYFIPEVSGKFTISYSTRSDFKTIGKERYISLNKITLVNEDDSLISSNFVKTGSIIDEPNEPVIEGRTFIGWFVGEDKFDFSQPIVSDVTLKAKYLLTQYKIIFKADGEVVKVDYFTVDTEEIIPPTLPDKEGYMATWEDFTLDPSKAPIVVNAIYVAKTYTLSFTGATAEVSDINVTFDQVIGNLPTVPAKEGYTGVWMIDELVLSNDLVWNFKENKTANAHYILNTYIVIFDGADIESQNVDYGGKVIKPETPSKEGYNFLGWFVGDKEWNFDTDVVKSNIVITARWEKVEPKGGCGGSIVACSAIVFASSIAGVALLLKGKKKKY